MYKLAQLDSLVKEIKSSVVNVLPDNLLEFAQKIKEIENEFTKIDREYEIRISPNVNHRPSLKIVLLYEAKPLYEYNTALDFYGYNGFYRGVGEDYDDPEEVISINNNPDLYKEIIEDKLITSFLENEKALTKLGNAKNALMMKNIYVR